MDNKITLPKFVSHPQLMVLPTAHLVREETCPLCKSNLVESFETQSDRPQDFMQVEMGRRYNQWTVSDCIYCPTCKLMFNHSKSGRTDIATYLNIAKSGGICSVVLKEPFKVSEYNTSVASDIPRGAILYTTKENVLRSHDDISLMNCMYKIKDGYTKKQGYKKVEILNDILDRPKWDMVASLKCVASMEDLFKKGESFSVPLLIVDLPAECKNMQKKKAKA